MIPTFLEFLPEAKDGTVEIAGLHLRASAAIPGLPALRPGVVARPEDFAIEQVGAGDRGVRSSLTALLGDEATEVVRHVGTRGIGVRAAGFGSVTVSADGRRLCWLPSDFAARQRPELILGPGLILALALQDVFCLHASAVLTDEGAVVFAGPSGAGKSTLAVRVAAEGPFPRLADDILPFRADASGALVLPRFPQLKLSPECQYPADAPSSHRLARFYLLTACKPGDPIVDRPLAPSVAALAVCGQAVASRLFPEPLLPRLLQAATLVAAGARVSELQYPRRPDAIPDIIRLIAMS